METMHATCVAVDGKGVLLVGPPGSGKSDLALRLIDEGAMLIADDVVAIEVAAGQLHGNFPSVPPQLKGAIEVRGIGLIKVPHRDWTRILLVVELDEETERLPQIKKRTIAGIEVEALALNAFEASAPARIRMMLHCERINV